VIGKISNMANSAVALCARYARGDRLELPDWFCPGSALERTESPERVRRISERKVRPWIGVHMVNGRVRKKSAASIPKKAKNCP
jgi:hypothetical protein